MNHLRENGHQILHDIVGAGFNVDHVIISQHGIFTVDTKTYRKPQTRNAVISIKEDQVLVNGYLIERNPIRQGKALAKWIRDLLRESTGKQFPVKAVVAFPGWFVEPMHGNNQVWVLNPKALPTFIENEPLRISPEDVFLVHSRLTSYIRSQQHFIQSL